MLSIPSPTSPPKKISALTLNEGTWEKFIEKSLYPHDILQYLST